MPITLLFSAALYYLVLDTNNNSMVRVALKNAIGFINIGNISIEVVYVLVALYLVVLFVIIAFITQPIKQVQNAVVRIEHGRIDGEIKIEAVAGDCRDSAVIRYADRPDPSYKLKKSDGKGENWVK